MNPQRARAAVDKLRQIRPGPRSAPPIHDAVAAFENDLARRHKSMGGIAAAWTAAVPDDLAAPAELVSMARGVLTVRVQDAPARFALDRFLRAGGEREVQRRSPVTLKKIRLVG
ncbi:MAG: DUF721 domain-containing protein [Phycisphaerales bacterium]|nr:DUF721 domain-containing protein [Phycisphaerales bacterium]